MVAKERRLVLVKGLVFEIDGRLIEIYEDLQMKDKEARFVSTVRGKGKTEVFVLSPDEATKEQADGLINELKAGERNIIKVHYDIDYVYGIHGAGNYAKFGKYTPEAA